jgi:hypothetical protein
MIINPVKNNYQISEAPFSENDKVVVEKHIKNLYAVNWILITIVIASYFLGIICFSIVFFIVICYYVWVGNDEINALKQVKKNIKLVLTGVVTKKYDLQECFIFFGDDKFEITYANIKFDLAVNDKVELHYVPKGHNEISHLLLVRKL